MRTLAIGDIHGSNTALKALSEYVGFRSDDVIVTLGDCIDRGPDSKGVIDSLIELGQTHQLINLKGNHEVMMENALLSEQERYFWLYNGGEATMQSFGLQPPLASRRRHLSRILGLHQILQTILRDRKSHLSTRRTRT